MDLQSVDMKRKKTTSVYPKTEAVAFSLRRQARNSN